MISDGCRCYVHVPKSGGSATREALRHYGWADFGLTHGPASGAPATQERAAAIRDPAAWLWSYYRHLVGRGMGTQSERWFRAYGRGSVAWDDVLHGWCHPETVVETPPPRGLLYSSTETDVLALQLRYGCGFYSAVLLDLLTEEEDGRRVWSIDRVLDSGNLDTALTAWTGFPVVTPRKNEATGPDAGRPVPLTPPQREALRRAERWASGVLGRSVRRGAVAMEPAGPA